MQLATRKFTVEQYHQMAEAEVFAPEERLELIRGEIIEMSPIGLKHATVVKRLNNLLTYQLHNQAIIGVQDPIQLDNFSEPQPDISVLKMRSDFYELEIPKSQDILWLIEVSDKTLKYDQEIKITLYAESKINEVWLVNLNNNTLEVYRDPQNNIYQDEQILQVNQSLSSLVFPNLIIEINEILL